MNINYNVDTIQAVIMFLQDKNRHDKEKLYIPIDILPSCFLMYNAGN